MPDGGSTFSVHIKEQFAAPSGTSATENASSGVLVYFKCEDLDQTIRSLKQKGLVFESDPVDQEWL